MLARHVLALAAALAFPVLAATAPAALPPHNVQDTYFGTVVDDPYRQLEKTDDPEVVAWSKAQAEFARSTLDAIPAYAAMKARVAELDEGAPAVVGAVKRDREGNYFYTKRGARENTLKLYVRKPGKPEELIADPDEWARKTGKPHAINYFFPSPDGKYVAFGVSAAGSEDASIYIRETANRQTIGEPITRTQFPGISWLADSKAFFFRREQEMKPGMERTQRYQNSRAWKHVVGASDSEDVLLAGPEVSPRMNVAPTDFAFVIATSGSKYAVAAVVAGVQSELRLYSAPLESVGKPGTPWKPICDRDDKITRFAVKGDDIYLLTYRTSPRFSLIRTALAAPNLKGAAVVVPASRRVIFDIDIARDALFLEVRDGAVKQLHRMPWGAKEPREVKLPLEGAVNIMAATPDVDGIVVSLDAWTRARQIYAVDKAGKATNTGLQPFGPFDMPEGLVATEVQVKSHDGALVPLSIIHRKGVKLDGSNPTLLYGYGSYGITEEPGYRATRLAWLERGGVYAVANVRGSGVYGQDWYKAGFKATKPNTWKDFIACAEYLVAKKYTTSAKLGILGGSAGGILVGRAMTERPDLFAAVVPAVGALDMVRMETTANGVPNIPEFGTVKKEDEFRALLAMSSYHHVKDHTAYPAVMLIHGVNDPRVSYWQSAKMAARLQAATSSGKPVLLDLDYEAGHGIGSTKQQRQKDTADIYTFLFWQLGHPDFQPTQAKP